MLTLQALLGVLPSARLAEADLPRFMTQALGRMTSDELAAASALLEIEQLVGYPRSLGAVMHALIEVMLRDDIASETLEPAVVERLIAAPAFLRHLEAHVGIESLVLRPGEVVSQEMRDLVGRHLRALPGTGAHLTLVAPVEVSRVPDLGYAVVRSAVLARPMSAEEAEALHEAWALLEETTGWPQASAREWESRFVRVASRPNFDAAKCVDPLSEMQPARRRTLWLALVAHHQQQELPEGHRPGAAGLRRRLEGLAFEDEGTGLIDALVDISSGAYTACGMHDGVRTGDFPITEEDVAIYASWVDHSEKFRTALRERAPEHLQWLLRLLTANEGGVLQVDIDPEGARTVRLFRDQYLTSVYRRDTSTLLGVDPLILLRSHLASGHDKAQILADVRELADLAQAERATRAQVSVEPEVEAVEEAPSPSPEEPPLDSTGPFAGLAPRIPQRPTTSPGINPFAGMDDGASSVDAAGDMPPIPLPPLPTVPTTRKPSRSRSDMTLPPLPDKPVRSRANRPRTRPRTRPFPDLEAMALPQPPSPTEPPRVVEHEPAIGEPGEAPAESVDETVVEAPPKAQTELALEADEPSAEEPTLLDERVDVVAQEPEASEVEAVDSMPSTSSEADGGEHHHVHRSNSRLVTPGQASRFYGEAFRELQVLERDLLERGAWPMARRRVDALATEAQELAVSLGPPARSGDMDFRAALRKVELVQSYLERIEPLMAGVQPPVIEPQGQGGRVLGRLSGLFKRDDEGA